MAFNRKQLCAELVAAGVPAMATDIDGSIALGDAYKTATGQWVVLPDGTTKWVGTGDPTDEPDAALLANLAACKLAHVPAPATPPLDTRGILRALTRLARGKSLSPEQETLLNTAEALE